MAMAEAQLDASNPSTEVGIELCEDTEASAEDSMSVATQQSSPQQPEKRKLSAEEEEEGEEVVKRLRVDHSSEEKNEGLEEEVVGSVRGGSETTVNAAGLTSLCEVSSSSPEKLNGAEASSPTTIADPATEVDNNAPLVEDSNATVVEEIVPETKLVSLEGVELADKGKESVTTENAAAVKPTHDISDADKSVTDIDEADTVKPGNVVESAEAVQPVLVEATESSDEIDKEEHRISMEESGEQNSISTNEVIGEGESKDTSSVTEDSEEYDDTASKLKASGISISLIKKKKEENKKSEEGENESDEKENEKEDSGSNPLEVGPNISVTMINKANSESQSGKFTLSLKSQSELLDPKKNDTKAPSANIANGTTDTISVSKINKSPAVSSPGATGGSTKPPASNKTSLLNSPPSLAGLLGHRNSSSSQGHNMPGLQPRPNGSIRSNVSLASGTVSEQLNAVASGITEYMRHGIEEVLRELSAQGSPEATIKGLQLELEKMQWRHQQEMAEVKQNIDIMIKEMKANIAKESQRTIDEYKKQAELEKQKAILDTKKKQWCAQCGKEAIFYCCWNTSYCDYPCQQTHWPTHMSTCSQTNQEEETPAAPDPIPEHKPVQSSSALLNSLSRQSNTMAMNSMSLANSGMNPGGMGFVMPGMGMGMRPGMGMRSPMGVSIRPGMPGQLTISRPYFM